MPTRWCPTPEQLMILEEMYKNGLRTPNASQIQKITAHLSNYGKIEGKNVFYWFQNHKARDRQKLRRKLLSKHNLVQHYNNFEGYNSVQPSSFAEYLPHQGGGEDAQMTNCKWKLDTPYTYKLQSMMAESNGDDCMMMMLREVCGIDQCCSHNKNRPLKTLELFPIKAIKNIKEEERQRFTTNFNQENDSTSSITLEINSFFVNVTSCKHG